MATTIETLEQRVTELEKDMAVMRQHMERMTAEPPMPPHIRNTPLLREAYLRQTKRKETAEQALQKLGIGVQPVGAEKLQAMMIAAGIRPEENLASREIMAMREEKGQPE